MKECNALGKKNGFKTMELLEAVILDPEEWTPENGMTTAAQKIQRKKIAGHFRKEIDVRRLSFSAHILFMKCADFLSFPGNLQESVSLGQFRQGVFFGWQQYTLPLSYLLHCCNTLNVDFIRWIFCTL